MGQHPERHKALTYSLADALLIGLTAILLGFAIGQAVADFGICALYCR